MEKFKRLEDPWAACMIVGALFAIGFVFLLATYDQAAQLKPTVTNNVAVTPDLTDVSDIHTKEEAVACARLLIKNCDAHPEYAELAMKLGNQYEFLITDAGGDLAKLFAYSDQAVINEGRCQLDKARWGDSNAAAVVAVYEQYYPQLGTNRFEVSCLQQIARLRQLSQGLLPK